VEEDEHPARRRVGAGVRGDGRTEAVAHPGKEA
jgi:hypothetical protein